MVTHNIKCDFPAVGFYFEVSIDGAEGIQAAFQEASGMEVSSVAETINEAGNNLYSHKVPGRTQYPNLVLKRGLMTDDSSMKDWVTSTLQEGLLYFIEPKDILVTLKDEIGEKVMAWNFVRAYPVKWSASGLNSMQSAIVVEQIDLAYSYWTFV